MISSDFESYTQFSENYDFLFDELLTHTNHDDYDAMRQWIAQNLQGADSLALHYASRLIRESKAYFMTFSDLTSDVNARIQQVKNRHLILLEPFCLDDQLHFMHDKMITMVDCDYVARLKVEEYLKDENLGNTLFLPAIGTALFQREDFKTLDFFESRLGGSLLNCESDIARYYYQDRDTQYWFQANLFVRHSTITTDHDEYIRLPWKASDVIMLNYTQGKEQYLRDKNIILPDEMIFNEFCRVIQMCHKASTEEKAVINMGLKQYQTFLNYQRINDIVNQHATGSEENDFQARKIKI